MQLHELPRLSGPWKQLKTQPDGCSQSLFLCEICWDTASDCSQIQKQNNFQSGFTLTIPMSKQLHGCTLFWACS